MELNHTYYKKKDNKLVSDRVNDILVYLVTWPIINFFLHQVVRPNNIYIYYFLMSLLYIVYIAKLLKGTNIIYKRIKVINITIVYIVILILLINLLIFNYNDNYLKNIFLDLFIKIFPAFIIATCVRDYDDLHKQLINKSYLQFGLMILTILYLTQKNNRYEIDYSMEWSYAMLVPTILILSNSRKKFLNLVIGLIGLICIFIYGSRGPLICILGFFIVYMIKSACSNYKIAIIYGMIFLPLVTYITVNYGKILEIINSKLMDFGIYSRNLAMLINIDFYNANGRNVIYKNIIEGIQQKPILGWGLMGDRYINYIKNFTGNAMNTIEQGIYAHNFILEICVQFGIIFGSIIIIIITYIILKSFVEAKSNSQKLIFSVFFSITMIQLVMSSSYLIMINFWIYMGLCLSIIQENVKIHR
ncbi:hypothetical protein KD33_04395 [Clostridium sp. NCR]|nr:hypothetical protein KD33_04395 [Clostridium sp. NCR]